MGTVAGYFHAADGEHGFLRTSDGTISQIDVPGASQTRVWGINASGSITGYCSGGLSFLRAPNGTFTTFEAPGAVGTSAYSINARGEVEGIFGDASDTTHWFIRTPQGGFTIFDIPGGFGSSGHDTINDGGEVAGAYFDSNSVFHGFVRSADGSITSFDAPGAGTAPYTGTCSQLQTINARGVVVGFVLDNSGASTGFIRSPSGKISTFRVPDQGASGFDSTFGQCINGKSTVAGAYVDGGGVSHGFALTL